MLAHTLSALTIMKARTRAANPMQICLHRDSHHQENARAGKMNVMEGAVTAPMIEFSVPAQHHPKLLP